MRGKGFQESMKQDAPEVTQIATKVNSKYEKSERGEAENETNVFVFYFVG